MFKCVISVATKMSLCFNVQITDFFYSCSLLKPCIISYPLKCSDAFVPLLKKACLLRQVRVSSQLCFRFRSLQLASLLQGENDKNHIWSKNAHWMYGTPFRKMWHWMEWNWKYKVWSAGWNPQHLTCLVL